MCALRAQAIDAAQGQPGREGRVADLELALAKDPNAKLRFKIKTLCLKYHPDKASATTLTSEEVARDLLELLQ